MKQTTPFFNILILAANLFVIATSPCLATETTLPISQYIYNYPHSLPYDYVYRTERIFGPQPARKWSFFDLFKEEVKTDPAAEAKELKLQVKNLTKQLLTNSKEIIEEEYIVLVTSFVNLNNLYMTSSLGRYFGEQLIGELQLSNVEVIDARKTPGIMIHARQGEYSLSREMEELSYIHEAHAVVVGTYTHANNQALINARLLRGTDGKVLSQANIVFALDPLTRTLLSDESTPPRKGRTITVQGFQE